MLYSEFVQGTGCKQNEKNYQIYLGLNQVYMNSDLTKDQIYSMGKKAVDNSMSKEEIEIREKVENEIKECEREINKYKNDLELNHPLMDKHYKDYCRSQIKRNKTMIKELKWVLA